MGRVFDGTYLTLGRTLGDRTPGVKNEDAPHEMDFLFKSLARLFEGSYAEKGSLF